MAKKRLVDVFAGAGSMAGALKARREAVESGNVQEAAAAFEKGKKKPAAKPSKTKKEKRMGVKPASNATVLRVLGISKDY
jgi:hypothetical protein